ncbi:agouti-signaling protein isoform X2 [Sphaerodactylus townsendi]|nr:agouti-signaling protein isoform X2 [Sphaerodactylus townsendi]XP_048353941.1 agouti-signaling protein isoform X2 [Sphaerodactylus townsendi]
MEHKNLLFVILFCCMFLTAIYSHMIFEEKQNTDNAVKNSKMRLPDLPPISIVDLTKTSKKISRKEAEKKKSMQRKKQQKKHPRLRPSPAPNCVATWASCKPPSRPCCDFCAFCHCRLFQTVCYCRMGNPNC